MGIKIKFEDKDGKVYKTPVIDDSGAIFKRPSVLTPDDEYDRNRKNFKPLYLTKNKTNPVNT